jgi:hypothetical protein
LTVESRQPHAVQYSLESAEANDLNLWVPRLMDNFVPFLNCATLPTIEITSGEG